MRKKSTAHLPLGKLRVLTPDGRLLLEANAEPGRYHLEFDLSLADATREIVRLGEYELDLIEDRRPECYGAITRATPDARTLLRRAAERIGLSARGIHRALRVARTVADLAGEERVGPAAMATAVELRGEE